MAVAKEGKGVTKSERRQESAETEYHRLLCEESIQQARAILSCYVAAVIDAAVVLMLIFCHHGGPLIYGPKMGVERLPSVFPKTINVALMESVLSTAYLKHTKKNRSTKTVLEIDTAHQTRLLWADLGVCLRRASVIQYVAVVHVPGAVFFIRFCFVFVRFASSPAGGCWLSVRF